MFLISKCKTMSRNFLKIENSDHMKTHTRIPYQGAVDHSRPYLYYAYEEPRRQNLSKLQLDNKRYNLPAYYHYQSDNRGLWDEYEKTGHLYKYKN